MMGKEINYLAVCLSLNECCWLPCMDFKTIFTVNFSFQHPQPADPTNALINQSGYWLQRWQLALLVQLGWFSLFKIQLFPL